LGYFPQINLLFAAAFTFKGLLQIRMSADTVNNPIKNIFLLVIQSKTESKNF
jgi:hypothetical protein